MNKLLYPPKNRALECKCADPDCNVCTKDPAQNKAPDCRCADGNCTVCAQQEQAQVNRKLVSAIDQANLLARNRAYFIISLKKFVDQALDIDAKVSTEVSVY